MTAPTADRSDRWPDHGLDRHDHDRGHDHHDHGHDGDDGHADHGHHDDHGHEDHDDHDHGHARLEDDHEAGDDHRPRGPIERVVLGAINLYRLTAPVRTPRCRYIPTCSTYAVEAVEVHGLGRGLWLAARRLGRCHPFGSFGFDPVPDVHENSNKPERT